MKGRGFGDALNTCHGGSSGAAVGASAAGVVRGRQVCSGQPDLSTPEKNPVMAFSDHSFFIRDSNAARCQLSIALGFVMWLQVLTEIAPCQVAIRAFLRTSGRVPRACP